MPAVPQRKRCSFSLVCQVLRNPIDQMARNTVYGSVSQFASTPPRDDDGCAARTTMPSTPGMTSARV
jgi:hypothetical protein